MVEATHTNKKTGMAVAAVVDQARVIYYRVKDGKRFGAVQSATEARFNQMYLPL